MLFPNDLLAESDDNSNFPFLALARSEPMLSSGLPRYLHPISKISSGWIARLQIRENIHFTDLVKAALHYSRKDGRPTWGVGNPFPASNLVSALDIAPG